MSKATIQVNYRMPVELKAKIVDVVQEKDEGSITDEIVKRLELTFDLTKADGYDLGYRDAIAHMTFAVTLALRDQGLDFDVIQEVINKTMAKFDKNN